MNCQLYFIFSRHTSTQACVFIPEDEKELRESMRNWTIAYTRTLEVHLQVCCKCVLSLNTSLCNSSHPCCSPQVLQLFLVIEIVGLCLNWREHLLVLILLGCVYRGVSKIHTCFADPCG